jgi:hypothetical protein
VPGDRHGCRPRSHAPGRRHALDAVVSSNDCRSTLPYDADYTSDAVSRASPSYALS